MPRSPYALRAISSLSALACALVASNSFAEDPPAPTGAPPADLKPLTTGPKAPADVPGIGEEGDDGTNVSVSAGGLLTTGNSRTLAITGGGSLESRFGANGVGVSLLGNYGQGAPPGSTVVASAENLQGRLRYDRYVIDRASFFLLLTGRHDRFQGLDFRLNVDPGFKYLFVKGARQAFWGEAGYDFQYDVRRDSARAVLDDSSNPVLDASGQPVLLDKTHADHSARLFVGYRQAFNKEVTFSTGLEYLQSVQDSTRWRMNFEALLAAKIAGGLAFGFGFTGRFDHEPLPGKKDLDTSSNVSLIYAFSDIPEKPAATCPCGAPPSPGDGLPPPPPGTSTDANGKPTTESQVSPATGENPGTPPTPVPASPPPMPPPATTSPAP